MSGDSAISPARQFGQWAQDRPHLPDVHGFRRAGSKTPIVSRSASHRRIRRSSRQMRNRRSSRQQRRPGSRRVDLLGT